MPGATRHRFEERRQDRGGQAVFKCVDFHSQHAVPRYLGSLALLWFISVIKAWNITTGTKKFLIWFDPEKKKFDKDVKVSSKNSHMHGEKMQTPRRKNQSQELPTAWISATNCTPLHRYECYFDS